MLHVKLNKSLGLDQTFWPELRTRFYNCLLQTFNDKNMNSSQKLSLIALIFKKGDNNLANYRPISLTNTDYKIIAIVLANRLQKVIDRVYQSAYIKGRYIGINARTIHDIFDYCENENYNGIPLFLDFKKSI